MTVTSEKRDGIVVLTLNRPPVNALDVETLDELTDALNDAARGEPQAVILTSEGRVFSAGADLNRVLEGDATYIDAGIVALSRCFETLFTFPRPVIAAVNGHALAGGCILTCACDYRIMASGDGRIGAIELAAGVPFPSWALEIVRYAVNNQHVPEVVYLARAYEPNDAVRIGLIDEIVDAADLMPRAFEMAGELARVPRQTFELMKRALRRDAVDTARRGTARDDVIKAAWRSPEVRDAIKRQMALIAGEAEGRKR